MENRQLKFRAWDKANECFYYSDRYENLAVFFAVVQTNIHAGNDMIIDQWVGQYGSKKQDFYEGDIVRFSGTLDDEPYAEDYMVKWDSDGLFGLFLINAQHPVFPGQWHDGPLKEDLDDDKDYCFMGTIHQNPELWTDLYK